MARVLNDDYAALKRQADELNRLADPLGYRVTVSMVTETDHSALVSQSQPVGRFVVRKQEDDGQSEYFNDANDAREFLNTLGN